MKLMVKGIIFRLRTVDMTPIPIGPGYFMWESGTSVSVRIQNRSGITGKTKLPTSRMVFHFSECWSILNANGIFNLEEVDYGN